MGLEMVVPALREDQEALEAEDRVLRMELLAQEILRQQAPPKEAMVEPVLLVLVAVAVAPVRLEILVDKVTVAMELRLVFLEHL